MKTSNFNHKEEPNKAQTQGPVHFLIIPFPSKGHTIPILDLTRRLLTRHPSQVIVTFLTTPTTFSLLQPLLNTFPSSLLQPLSLSPPPSSPSLTSKIRALNALEGPIISWFNSHPSPPSVILSDFFLPWTHTLSTTLHIPRVVFYPSGAFASSIYHSMWRTAPSNPGFDPEFPVRFNHIPGSPRFDWFELPNQFRTGKPGEPEWDHFRSEMLKNVTSYGAVFNTFSGLESEYIDHFKTEMGHDRVWAVGPLLPDYVDTHRGGPASQDVLTWLEGKENGSVVYVCFGSRTFLTVDQVRVLGEALECSGVQFVWCVSGSDGDEYVDRAAGRGFVIRGWAPQVMILRHKAVGVFLTHCGWNSVMESVASGVMMVGWPMGADQYWDAWLVVERLGLGLRVKCDDGSNGVPDPVVLGRLLAESLDLARPERARVLRLKDEAATAIESGSSAAALENLVHCLSELS